MMLTTRLRGYNHPVCSPQISPSSIRRKTQHWRRSRTPFVLSLISILCQGNIRRARFQQTTHASPPFSWPWNKNTSRLVLLQPQRTPTVDLCLGYVPFESHTDHTQVYNPSESLSTSTSMPHAENDTAFPANGDMNSAPMTNGEKSHSKVLLHLQSYPVVHDSLEYYKTLPYGAKSLSILQRTYASFIAPLHPYLQTPYSYLSPYLSRADELGDTGLTKVDDRFPIVKEDTSKLKETVQGYAFFPLKVAGEGKAYVCKTWDDEYRKTKGQEGLVKSAKAILSTELKIGHDGYTMLKEYLNKGKQETSKKVDEVRQ